jgi:hypothetical protein
MPYAVLIEVDVAAVEAEAGLRALPLLHWLRA